MHEWAIADNLVKLVAEAARREGLELVSKVVIRVGVLQQVVPETLEMAFGMMAEETDIAGARLKIEPVLLKLRCRNCRAITIGTDFVFTCEGCGSVDVDIISGKELYIDYMEGEKKGT